jgi:hypothetical protein
MGDAGGHSEIKYCFVPIGTPQYFISLGSCASATPPKAKVSKSKRKPDKKSVIPINPIL